MSKHARNRCKKHKIALPDTSQVDSFHLQCIEEQNPAILSVEELMENQEYETDENNAD